MVRTVPGSGSVVRFLPGEVALQFSPANDSKPMPGLDHGEDIRQLTADRDALAVERHLDGVASERVALAALPETLKDYDVLVWNQYRLGDDGLELPEGAAERLAEYAQNGGGLVLITNAVRLAPHVGGAGVALGDTHHAGHRPNRQCDWAGLRPLQEGHPLFEGMNLLDTDLGAVYPLLEPKQWELLKRLAMTVPDDMLLAEHLCKWERTEKGVERAAWEPGHGLATWQHGAGRVVAYAGGLREGHGDPGRYPPNETLARFLLNAVRYASGGHESPRIGVLR
jgi:hypothetical protein